MGLYSLALNDAWEPLGASEVFIIISLLDLSVRGFSGSRPVCLGSMF